MACQSHRNLTSAYADTITGLPWARGSERTDSTHVLARIRDLNRLEPAGETVRAALETLAAAAPGWLAELPAVQALRRIGSGSGSSILPGRGEGDPAGGARAWPPAGKRPPGLPYDLDARYSEKHGMGWLGYRATSPRRSVTQPVTTRTPAGAVLPNLVTDAQPKAGRSQHTPVIRIEGIRAAN